MAAQEEAVSGMEAQAFADEADLAERLRLRLESVAEASGVADQAAARQASLGRRREAIRQKRSVNAERASQAEARLARTSSMRSRLAEEHGALCVLRFQVEALRSVVRGASRIDTGELKRVSERRQQEVALVDELRASVRSKQDVSELARHALRQSEACLTERHSSLEHLREEVAKRECRLEALASELASMRLTAEQAQRTLAETERRLALLRTDLYYWRKVFEDEGAHLQGFGLVQAC